MSDWCFKQWNEIADLTVQCICQSGWEYKLLQKEVPISSDTGTAKLQSCSGSCRHSCFLLQYCVLLVSLFLSLPSQITTSHQLPFIQRETGTLHCLVKEYDNVLRGQDCVLWRWLIKKLQLVTCYCLTPTSFPLHRAFSRFKLPVFYHGSIFPSHKHTLTN